MVLPQAELLLGEDHPFARDAAHVLRLHHHGLTGVAIDVLRPELGVRHERADGEVRRARHHLPAAAGAVFHGRELELVGIRMLLELDDPPDPDVLPGRSLDALHLGPGHVKTQREIVDWNRDVDVLAQPGERHPDEH